MGTCLLYSIFVQVDKEIKRPKLLLLTHNHKLKKWKWRTVFGHYLLLHRDNSRASRPRPSLLLISVRARFFNSISTQRAACDSAATWMAVRPVALSILLTAATTPPSSSPLTSAVAQITESKLQQRCRIFKTAVDAVVWRASLSLPLRSACVVTFMSWFLSSWRIELMRSVSKSVSTEVEHEENAHFGTEFKKSVKENTRVSCKSVWKNKKEKKFRQFQLHWNLKSFPFSRENPNLPRKFKKINFIQDKKTYEKKIIKSLGDFMRHWKSSKTLQICAQKVRKYLDFPSHSQYTFPRKFSQPPTFPRQL